MAFKVKVSGFEDGALIPKSQTCEGGDVSPGLEWLDAPAEAASFVLIMDDPDAPAGTWNHWLLYDLPAAAKSIAPAYKPGQLGVSGTNDFGRLGYGGPCPPKGNGPHRYFFKLFAVSVPTLRLKAGAKRAELDRAMRGKVVAQAQYMGRFERK